DGWGINPRKEANAILQARPPFYNSLVADYPHTRIYTSGKAVGLPDGQMGNSEVGHMTLGAGRIVYQDFSRINKAIEDGSFFKNPALVRAMEAAKREKGALHLLGLVSDGGVHSHIDHLFALLEMAKDRGLKQVVIHAFLDGRDTPPQAGMTYLKQLNQKLRRLRVGQVATVMGRYYAMDRDSRWNRIQKAYEAMVLGLGNSSRSSIEAITRSYEAKVTDEFMVPTVIMDKAGKPVATIQDRDSVIFFNFRADRARQLTRVFTEKGFSQFTRKTLPQLSSFVCMTSYGEQFDLPVAFGPVRLTRLLGEILGQKGMRQLRIAETEKYAHVTYFFNGGDENMFPGEERVLIPSPRHVATYDQSPEMSAAQVTEEAVKRIKTGSYDFVLMNYANPDMVGHTGVLSAAVKTIGVIDTCLARVIGAIQEMGGVVILTADHGNLEKMIDYDTGQPHTSHTTHPVPLLITQQGLKLRPKGTLADVAPTVLHLMGIQPPAEMTGRSLIVNR
ncbi:MAG: 2,3-bisphosphoglycerate-independent phosphoglycerate mutase, partial [Nitrospira sp.]|nr:2,3-bisphosphoglycerate-independent phosphoglycerate mutase [Nitrospira sp.]